MSMGKPDIHLWSAILHRDESTLPTGQSESLVYAKKSVLITDYAHRVTYSLPDTNTHGITTKSTSVPLTYTSMSDSIKYKSKSCEVCSFLWRNLPYGVHLFTQLPIFRIFQFLEECFTNFPNFRIPVFPFLNFTICALHKTIFWCLIFWGKSVHYTI